MSEIFTQRVSLGTADNGSLLRKAALCAAGGRRGDWGGTGVDGGQQQDTGAPPLVKPVPKASSYCTTVPQRSKAALG